MRASRCAALAAFVCLSCFGQRRLEPDQMYERIVCVVPMIGKGTLEDPRRPMFTPADPGKAASERKEARKVEGREDEPDTGIIAYASQETDDGQSAIVEFVARDRRAFKEILESSRAGVKTFRKERMSANELSSELKKLKRNFDLNAFRVAVQ